jgi:hypothetical protein
MEPVLYKLYTTKFYWKDYAPKFVYDCGLELALSSHLDHHYSCLATAIGICSGCIIEWCINLTPALKQQTGITTWL